MRRRPVPRAVGTAAACWVLFGLWALVSGHPAGDAAAALPTAALACCLAVAAMSAAGLPDGARHVLLAALLTVAAAVAISRWVGVALHVEPLALVSSGLWRASSMLTYANATAAFVAVSLVVAVTVGPRSRLATNGLVAVLLLGLVLTMSRAGALALLVAAIAYVVLGRDVRLLRRHAPALAAVFVVTAGVLAIGAALAWPGGVASALPTVGQQSPPMGDQSVPTVDPSGSFTGLADPDDPALGSAAPADDQGSSDEPDEASGSDDSEDSGDDSSDDSGESGGDSGTRS